MKRNKILIISVLLTIMFSAISTFAEQNIKVILDGNPLQFDVPPQIIDGRTMVPMRTIFEALGATVQWDAENEKIIAIKDSITITMYINKKAVIKNGKSISLDIEPQIIDGRTLVPVRAIAECLNARIEWLQAEKSVKISNEKIFIKNDNWLDGGYYYLGDFKDDKPNGEGCAYYEDGSIRAEGSWLNGNLNGECTTYYNNGNIKRKGFFKEDMLNGYAKTYYENGNLQYDGEWVNGECQGNGKYYSESGELEFVGEFLNGQPNGKGTVYKNGKATYSGDYVDGVPNGQGTFFYENGRVQYKGEVENGLVDGTGVLYDENGNVTFKGKFKDGKTFESTSVTSSSSQSSTNNTNSTSSNNTSNSNSTSSSYNQTRIAQLERDIKQQQEKIQNILAEKNVKMFMGGQWVNTYDSSALASAQSELQSLQDQLDLLKAIEN